MGETPSRPEIYDKPRREGKKSVRSPKREGLGTPGEGGRGVPEGKEKVSYLKKEPLKKTNASVHRRTIMPCKKVLKRGRNRKGGKTKKRRCINFDQKGSEKKEGGEGLGVGKQAGFGKEKSEVRRHDLGYGRRK